MNLASPAIVKRSLTLSGHRTSVSLEEPFWLRLRQIAARRGTSVAALVAAIDQVRGRGNLSSAIRLFVLAQTEESEAANA